MFAVTSKRQWSFGSVNATEAMPRCSGVKGLVRNTPSYVVRTSYQRWENLRSMLRVSLT